MKKIDLSKISKVVNVIDKMENVPIDEINKIPNCCGAYIIAFKSGKLYVGTSKNVRTRPKQHKSKNADEFPGEIMDKVSVCLTKNLYDADILEQWLIRELKPELNKRHQDGASTWKDGSEKKLLSVTSEELSEVFDKLSDKILSLPNVKKKAVPSGWITFQISARKNFCMIWVKKDRLWIDLKVDNNFNDPNNLSFEIEWTTQQAFNRRIEMYNDEQFDGIFNLIQQAYQNMNKSSQKKS